MHDQCLWLPPEMRTQDEWLFASTFNPRDVFALSLARTELRRTNRLGLWMVSRGLQSRLPCRPVLRDGLRDLTPMNEVEMALESVAVDFMRGMSTIRAWTPLVGQMTGSYWEIQTEALRACRESRLLRGLERCR